MATPHCESRTRQPYRRVQSPRTLTASGRDPAGGNFAIEISRAYLVEIRTNQNSIFHEISGNFNKEPVRENDHGNLMRARELPSHFQLQDLQDARRLVDRGLVLWAPVFREPVQAYKVRPRSFTRLFEMTYHMLLSICRRSDI